MIFGSLSGPASLSVLDDDRMVPTAIRFSPSWCNTGGPLIRHSERAICHAVEPRTASDAFFIMIIDGSNYVHIREGLLAI